MAGGVQVKPTFAAELLCYGGALCASAASIAQRAKRAREQRPIEVEGRMTLTEGHARVEQVKTPRPLLFRHDRQTDWTEVAE
ncbi:unnamed protein product [Fusarium graminearum]|uniref:Chromosome 3, complete genome n=1 Tax=Gibberella zeae (strain ATCC MYA-4620 / CBS 123657 / FGSC 9075 / NRRL 31084 / PH-1) TaxID=229533 RepID=A0A098E1H4_GIBZE|nr:unnamed protein product [Fusarium graminearum]CZS84723.1 unnamed protein product [Fusarium graminearum]